MNPFNRLAFVFAFLLLFSGFGSAQPVKIIFDSDMGPDFDDIGAITILHALAAKGECEILATMASDGYPYIAPTLEVFNRYFQKPEIPIGVPGSDAPNFFVSQSLERFSGCELFAEDENQQGLPYSN